MALVAVAALVVGLTADDGPRTTEDRVTALGETVRCPTCRSQSVAESEAPVAREIRAEIADRVEAGESDAEIRDYLVSRYGQEVLLTPPAEGVAGLVWVIPVVAVVAALAGLAVAFRRWRDQPVVHATAADRALVDAALAAEAEEAARADRSGPDPAGDLHPEEGAADDDAVAGAGGAPGTETGDAPDDLADAEAGDAPDDEGERS